MTRNILLVQPDFPSPNKSRWHKDTLPIGLLKLASYHRDQGHEVQLVKDKEKPDFEPDKILVTSIFTYWEEYVKDCVEYFKEEYPETEVWVGGVYASLMPERCKEYTGCDRVFEGVHEEAENYEPAYDLVDVDFQIIHTTRGCIRNCDFCGVNDIEPEFEYKESIKDEIESNKLIFYDNNILANPNIENILKEIAEYRHNGQVVRCESQSGFDGRLLTPELANLIKKARFQYPRIAWDHSYSEHEEIKRQIDMLLDAGYNPKDIFIFMIYNWGHDFREVEKKRIKCWEWGVQISDCRFRPLDQTYDNYNPHKKGQTNSDYHIHSNWTDYEVKQFRRNVRRQNICVRYGKEFHSSKLERGKDFEGEIPNDAWYPGEVTPPQENK